jgi:sortase (surface protein transpeptidase)
MSTTSRSSAASVVLTAVAFAAAASGLLALVGLALFLIQHSPSTAGGPLFISETAISITPVPTGTHLSSLGSSALPTLIPVTISQPTPLVKMAIPLAVTQFIPMPLVDPALSLFSGSVEVPLEIQIPVLKIKAPVLGVGLTSTNAMASPFGTYANDPIWQTVFWYRGSGIPGDVGTATFAGHYDDTLGRPAVFGYLGDLQIGDLIIVRDTRNGLDIPFIVTETKRYTDQEAAAPDIITRIFGSKSISDAASRPIYDQISHLTLITCGGEWVHGSFDLRLIVYAVRAHYPLAIGE